MRFLSIVLILSVVVFSCPALFAQTGSSDDRIYDEVRRKLAADSVVKGGGFEVDVKDGVVTLRGKVREEKQKRRAERITKKVKGVKSVVNELRVEPY
jgi:osmotically-inducible protein OsmY